MSERASRELALLRTRYPDLEFLEAGQWVRIPSYPTGADIWTVATVDTALQIPESVGIRPYGFYVRPRLVLKSGGTIQNYTEATTPFGGEWGKFSWEIDWRPADDIHAGTNLLDFVVSFAARLRQGA